MPKKKKSRLEKRHEKDWQEPTQKKMSEFARPTIEIKLIEEKPKKIKLIEEKPKTKIKLVPVKEEKPE